MTSIPSAAASAPRSFVLLIHGGAGGVTRDNISPEREQECRAVLADALRAGYAVLMRGGAALDAVEAAVCVMEDSPAFNAGRGSVLNAEGVVEMDATIMDGSTQRAGAVCGVRAVRNPIRAARAVMERTRHVLLCGPEADRFAADTAQLPTESPAYFVTERRLAQLRQAQAIAAAASAASASSAAAGSASDRLIELDHGASRVRPDGAVLSSAAGPDSADIRGTVGAVARDAAGRLAAATSTGGLSGKRPGRVGDSALPGAGTWADEHCAVSATGDGEMFIRAAFAAEVSAGMRLAQRTLQAATESALARVSALGGEGGCVAVSALADDLLGASPFCSAGMFRGRIGVDGVPHVAMFGDEVL